MTDNAKLYISTTQQETASLPDPNTLLAREVYDRLYTLIVEALQEASKALKEPGNDFDSLRTHNAVLIDGARGTGKSTVLVNLPAYLKQRANTPYDAKQILLDTRDGRATQNQDLLKRVHILKPVDPTLLEEHDDLFLHVIVAAVLSDCHVQQAQQHNEPAYRAMLRALEELAHGLESVDAQKEERGLDKLRSFIGNRQLNGKVHAFFGSVLTLLGKDLLVLTIDDVDTALDRAYENLEIVRRYLNTPLVLPIISGDLKLYNEVIWREFHGKFVKPTPKYKERQAYDLAIALATEYQRKILPVPNRMRMPDVAEYLNDFQIELRSPGGDQADGTIASLGAFHAWLEGIIAGPVNALENTRLALPISSIRALTQLIRRCGQGRLLEMLPSELREAKNALAAKRAGQLAPGIGSELIVRFETDYANAELAKDRDFRPVYKAFADAVRELEARRSDKNDREKSPEELVLLSERLREQLGSERKAGPTCLVLEAMQHWYGASLPGNSILATALFQPLRHSNAAYDGFSKPDSLASWRRALTGQLPGYWLEQIEKREVMLPYPLPESGRWGRLGWNISRSSSDPREQLLLRLLTHGNYYSESGRATKVNIGRMFELLVASLVHDVSAQDLVNLLHRAPFHSTSTLAPTKTQNSAPDEFDDDEGAADTDLNQLLVDAIDMLVKAIQDWRDVHQLERVRFSPWLVYNVFNKVFNQAQIFNRNQRIDRREDYAQMVFSIGLHGFYTIWSACGSFEKGPLFGLPARISTVNLRTTNAFEQNPLFRQNILPFFPQGGSVDSDVACYGKAMRAATYYLGNHPLLRWLENAVGDSRAAHGSAPTADEATPAVTATATTNSVEEQANRRLRVLLGIKYRKGNITSGTLENRLVQQTPEQIRVILSEMHDQYPETETLRRLELAYAKVSNNHPQES
ncbi:hypothetical protein WM04_21520 [Burkholderia ubonensis]|uniref:antiviral RADAR system adenosine triphosphatase RdrA n=1 Tax=Burkholderia ubonensis TaxID=101571 RepID=UPI00075531F8|nr:antiviral RADAR system adenosine triphosphatase RdrA [Burkholderia ubonensis]KWI28110.1 hypothetical protein WM04_21520 [Burkholderia ubonensis]OJB15107.1 hypothetical protein BGV53_22670 [Burkholderia ubonensis]